MRTWYRRDSPVCPHCHYDLAGLARVEHCPECGERLDWEAAYQPDPRFVLVHTPGSDEVAVEFLPTKRAPLRAIAWGCMAPGALIAIASLLFAGPARSQLVGCLLGGVMVLVGFAAWAGAASGHARVTLSRGTVSLRLRTWAGARETVFPRSEVQAFGPRKVGEFSRISNTEDFWPLMNLVIKHEDRQHVAARGLSDADAETIMAFIREHDPLADGPGQSMPAPAVEQPQ